MEAPFGGDFDFDVRARLVLQRHLIIIHEVFGRPILVQLDRSVLLSNSEDLHVVSVSNCCAA